MKRQFYNVGLQVLWRGFAYGPGQITTWLLLGATQSAAFFGLSAAFNKIFGSPVLQRSENYMTIGVKMYLSACLFLNMMVINYFVTQRLK